MFRGINNLTLDAKGRLAVPARYRERIQEACRGQLVVTIDRDHCLLLYPLPEWEALEERLVRLPSLNKQARELQRLLLGHATEVEMDGHGRLLLPPELRGFAGLERDGAVGPGQEIRTVEPGQLGRAPRGQPRRRTGQRGRPAR